MTGEVLVTCVFGGLVAGWLATFYMKAGPYGLIGDLVLGLVGGLVGGGIFRVLGFFPRAGMWPVALLAFVGAAGVLFAQRQLWHQPPLRRRRRRSIASGAWRAEQD
jgi:uncharacterized membrane protein YeaQ/YmgE (transglycosylase-associated protein family)